MKRIIILATSGCTFILLFILGIIALLTNTWGINFNRDGLFPSFEVAVINADNEYKTATEYQDKFDLDIGKYYIKNNTGDDLDVESSTTLSNRQGEHYDITLHAFSKYLISFEEDTFTVSLIPTDYQYYYSHGRTFSTVNDGKVYLSVDRNSDIYHNSKQVSGNSNVFTIKDGEKYEIKLP